LYEQNIAKLGYGSQAKTTLLFQFKAPALVARLHHRIPNVNCATRMSLLYL
jgi:hypothetical protein